MAETETETTALAPRELVTEIERTRANLAQTIDEIADRVAPGNIARRAGDRAKERISQIDPNWRCRDFGSGATHTLACVKGRTL